MTMRGSAVGCGRGPEWSGEKAERERLKREEREFKAAGGKAAMEIEMLGFMKKGETVLESLQRLGSKAKKDKTKSYAALFNVHPTLLIITPISLQVQEESF